MRNSKSGTMPTDTASRQPRSEFAIYKPTRSGSGGVIRLSLAREKRAVFVEAAFQKGEKSFDWQQKVTMKWGMTDLGEVLAVLERRQEEAKLFHKTEKHSTACHIRHQSDQNRNNYFVQISRQVLDSKSVTKVALPISQGEAAVVATLLRAAVVCLAGWQTG